MGFITGVQATIDGVPCVRQFWIPDQAVASEGFCSRGAGGEFVDRGNSDWTCMVMAYGASPAKLPGATGTFKGSTREGNGWEGPFICGQVDIHWEIEQANLVYHYMQLLGNGELTMATNALTDTGVPSPSAARNYYMAVGGADYSIRRAQLTIMDLTADYNDSATEGFTRRKSGNTRATFEFEAYFASPSEYPRRGTFQDLKFYADRAKTTFWRVQYGYIEESTPMLSEAGEDGHAVGAFVRVKGKWSLTAGTSAGTITAPDGTIIWP